MFRTVLAVGLALGALGAIPAFANDSTAELSTGGLILSRTDAVSMKSEDLFISKEEVAVDYVFQNITDKDVDTIVAFPMPDIDGNPYEMPSIPNDPNDNFLGFEVTIDGAPVKTQLQQRAIAVGVDVSADLEAQHVPFYPFGDAAKAALAKLPQAVADDWLNRGMIIMDEYDDGSGMKSVRTPFWKLRSTFWWHSTFPAGKEVHVSHRYKPSLGATVGLTFFFDDKFQGQYDAYKARYCMDADFENAVRKAEQVQSPDGNPALFEARIAYILTTGGNWAAGNIEKFKLTVDKGNARSLISFCGQNVRKTGPTAFEMTADDFYPDHDVDILILDHPEDLRNEDGSGN